MSSPTPLFFSPRYARYALWVLFTINLFNYIDRQIIFGVFPLVQADLELSDAELGWLASAFVFLYLLGSIPLGVLGDRLPRNRLIGVGVAVWGAATFLSGLARSYGQLFFTRALVGIGEASYGPTATAMVSDFFPKARRGFVNSLFNAAIPVGGAIGVTVGGLVGSRFGWRGAFLLIGIPSLVLAVLAWRLADPPRGGQDVAPEEDPVLLALPAPAAPGLVVGILGLFRTPTFVMVCAVGMLVAFATGAFAAWLPSYLHRVKGFSVLEASIWYGSLSASAGLLGVIVGGLIGDALARRTAAGHLLTIAGGFILSAPFALVFLLHDDRSVFLPALFLAVFFLVLYVGSVNAVIHNVVNPSLRATAVAIFVFLIHLGGDFLSPGIVGLISDRRRSLQAAMLLLPVVVFFAGVIALAAVAVVAADMRRVERTLGMVSSGQAPDG
ncbi:MAG TPA: MFS transporter [Methylomirabilota bacterium]|jgi:MFS family permease|nr:MFS transporter [Methylomirabilota bacterium]